MQAMLRTRRKLPTRSSTPYKRILAFLAETGSLMYMPRTHIRQLINTFDSVASHSHHTALIAYCLTRMEGLSHEEGLVALAMGVLHDTAETRTGDLDFVAKHYAKTDDEGATENQLKGLPFAQDLEKIFVEYDDRQTLVSRCTKDADSLEQIYQQWVLTHLGNKLAQTWLEGDFQNRVPFLYTNSAKKLAQAMKASSPHDWWIDEMLKKNLNYEYLNGRPKKR